MDNLDYTTRARKCEKCGISKPDSDFYVSGISKRTGARWFKRSCKACVSVVGVKYRSSPRAKAMKKAGRPSPEQHAKDVMAWRSRHPLGSIFHGRKANARNRGVLWDIEMSDLLPLPERCPALGVRLFYGVGRGPGPRPNSPSVDRINPSLGYVKGNVAIISHRANIIKHNATADEVEAVAKWMRQQGL